MRGNLPLQVLHSGYAENCKTGVLVPPSTKVVGLYSARVLNQSGGAVDAAICKKFAPADWKSYTIVAASTPDALENTSVLQGGGAVNLFDTTNNDGFMIGAKNKFNIIGLNISTADSGTPVYVLKYFNGTSYVTLTTQAAPVSYTTGTQLLVFQAPVDWVVGTTAGVGGSASLYNIQVLASTAPGQITQANAAWICQFLEYQSFLENNGALEFSAYYADFPYLFSGLEELLPYFSDTANAKNSMRVIYSIQP